MRIYLFLACFWSLAALIVFVYQHYFPTRFFPTTEDWTVLGTGMSTGWLLLAFAGWNLLRWWTTLRSKKEGGQEQ